MLEHNQRLEAAFGAAASHLQRRVDERVNIMICIFSNYQLNLLHIKLVESGNGDGTSC